MGQGASTLPTEPSAPAAMMELSDLLAIAETVAPELKDRLTILIRQPDWPLPPNWIGAASWDPPPWLEASDAIIIFEPIVADLSTLLHEMAHLVPAPIQPTKRDSADLEGYQRGWTEGYQRGRTQDLPRYYDHEDRFIRRLLHLAYRAEQHGHSVDLAEAFYGPHYGLRTILDYQTALGDEPARCLGMTFAEIEAIEPPEQFARVFAEDRHLEAIAAMRRQFEAEAHAVEVKILKLENHILQLFADYKRGSWDSEASARVDAAVHAGEAEHGRLTAELAELESRIAIFAPPNPEEFT